MSAQFQHEFPINYDPNYNYAELKARINKVKLSHRSDFTLKEWTKDNYYETFPKIVGDQVRWLESIDALYNGKPHPQATSDLSHLSYGPAPGAPFNVNDLPCNKDHLSIIKSVPRVDTKDLTVEQFREQYEKPNLPVMITGLTKGWPSENWDFKALANSKYADARFRVGDDDDGRAIRISLRDYLHYGYNNKDDSPLYLFEDAFDENDIAKGIINEYKVPKYFNEDIFPLLPFDRRPPFRWILVGPPRSGTRMHIDPLDSSAWNVVVSGRKRWVLLSPELSKDMALGKMVWNSQEKTDGRSPQAIYWFSEILPRVREFAQRTGRIKEIVEFIQYPGEVIMVPSLWWHAVMNLDETVSFTQNWVSNSNFPAAYRAMRVRRAHAARRLVWRLKFFYPHLYEMAKKVDEEDNFKWKIKYVSKTQGLSPETRRKLRIKALEACKELDAERFKNSNVDDADVQEILDVMMSGDSDSSDDDDDDDEEEAKNSDDEYE